MKKLAVLFLLFWATAYSVLGQKIQFEYINKIYRTNIKTVACYPIGKEQQIPVLLFGSNDQLLVAFDDLESSNTEYSYTIEHCTSDWRPSDISSLEYIDGFSSDRIFDSRVSFNTIQKYTHYEFQFPNDQIRPKIPGNYLLKIFEGSENKPIISQRIYITSNRVNVEAEVTASPQVVNRNKNQKVNFTISHPFPIANPFADVKTIVMQNFNPLTAKLSSKPTFIRPGALIYNDLTINDFAGGYEFRKFDLRSLRSKGENIQTIFRDTANSATLFVDQISSSNKYASQFDENGRFYVRSQDGRDARNEADYVYVHFTLASPNPIEGGLFVVGGFNNYDISDASKLSYSPQSRQYVRTSLLKQGLYDYMYITPTGDTFKSYNGSFVETENSYQIFVYYKKPGSRWEELVAVSQIYSRPKVR